MTAGQVGVSRETRDRLERFAALLLKWNEKINLIGKSTVAQIWDRHIHDSLQIAQIAIGSNPKVWADLGSGGGFPGLVAAIALQGAGSETVFHLVESDQRKAAFLREAARQLETDIVVHASRIEETEPLTASVVSARALAPLRHLCDLSARHLSSGGIAVFPKGASWRSEVEEARTAWAFDLDVHASVTDPQAAILVLRGLCHG
ncbi:MAG: 16S rRNA (guanine(527)-N(7))-methyltransferase RsmG [Paracoccaceae bacterium]